MCEIESGSFCLWKEKVRRIIAVTLGKKSNTAWNIQPSHNAHTGKKRGTKNGERTGIEAAITIISWLPVGLGHCLWAHLETLLDYHSLTHALMNPNKRGVWHITHWRRTAALASCYYKAAVLKWAWITIYCSARVRYSHPSIVLLDSYEAALQKIEI